MEGVRVFVSVLSLSLALALLSGCPMKSSSPFADEDDWASSEPPSPSSAASVVEEDGDSESEKRPSRPPPTPVDWRHRIAPEDFHRIEPGQWVSPVVDAEFPFDELIYSWSARLPEKQAFRLYLLVEFTYDDFSPWLYAGYWGDATDPVTERRTNPTFERGRVVMDQLLLEQKARAYQFKVTDNGEEPLEVLPSLHVITTDNHPPRRLVMRQTKPLPAVAFPDTLLDLPMRRQVDSDGTPRPNRCQTAALAAALEYYGHSIPLEDLLPYTDDPEYRYPGIWPRTIGAAVQFGFDAYIDRFRDWTAVRQALAQNKVILCSITMPRDDTYVAPPYPSMGGHIVALNGVTDDGRVVVTDSALARSGRGYRCQWLVEDFEKVWMRNKGGVGMVIRPPEGAEEKLITDLPPFPTDRTGERIDINAEL